MFPGSEPDFVQLLRTPLKELVQEEFLRSKTLVCVTGDEILVDCLPKIDIKQLSLSNPDGVTTLLVAPNAQGQNITSTDSVCLLDAREIVTVFYHFLKSKDGLSTASIISEFLSLTMQDIVDRAPKFDKVKFVDWSNSLASVLGEFGNNTRIVATEASIDSPHQFNMRFVFSVKDFLIMLDDHEFMKDSEGRLVQQNPSISSFGSTLIKPVSILTLGPTSLCCVMKDDPILQVSPNRLPND
eukprot:GHVH01004986.1.p1 GENE.GHVH01004986.1~~GHVH01004986.1.p1  ORF type:complete len:241 (-),score=36.48 GHVH01004986.1:33-755(-)